MLTRKFFTYFVYWTHLNIQLMHLNASKQIIILINNFSALALPEKKKKNCERWHDTEIYVERTKVGPIINECVAEQTKRCFSWEEKREQREENAERRSEFSREFSQLENKISCGGRETGVCGKREPRSGEISGVRMSSLLGRQKFVFVIVKLNRWMLSNYSPQV